MGSMNNSNYMIVSILISLSVQFTSAIKMTNILPTMKPFNKTHCEIFYEDSFEDLPNPEEYTAKLIWIEDKTNERWVEPIQDNLAKVPGAVASTCIPITEKSL